MDPDSPRVALLDGGELDDVRARLIDLGIEYCDARHATIGVPVPLLLSAPEYARALAKREAEAPPRHLHAVIGSDPADLGAPADLTLLRPLETSVLRLMTRRETKSSGRERRLSTRVALGMPVKARIGDDCREVILARLSIGGCALISPARMRDGATVEIELPPEMSAPRALALSGRVLASRELTTADGHTFDVSVAFDVLDLIDRVTLRAVMARHAIDFRPISPGTSARPERSLKARVLPQVGERREGTRRRFQRRVLGVCDGIAHVLMAYDLSCEGVRIEPNERLDVGDDLTLALFGMPDTVPLLGRAVLERFDDVDGSFLRFVDLRPDMNERMKALIATLVPIDLEAARG